MNKRLGVIGIVIKDRKKVNSRLNEILSDFGDIIIGRMGVPSREHELCVISLIVEGTSDDIGAMTGKLGNLEGVNLKSAFTSVVIKD